MPCLSELHYNSIYNYPVSISFIYYSNFENSSKQHFLNFLILSPLAPHYNSPPCLQSGIHHSEYWLQQPKFTFWESEKVLTSNLEISNNKEYI